MSGLLVGMDEVRAFFFEGCLNGWAGGVPGKSAGDDMPNHKEIRYPEYGLIGGFVMVDQWSKTPDSNKSAGTRTIFYRNIPVWWMNWSGWYDESAIPLLKKALCEAYGLRFFMGGRGPINFSADSITYVNESRPNDFQCFMGEEHIFTGTSVAKPGVLLGYNRYSGMSLL